MLFETYLQNIELGIIPKSKTKQARLFGTHQTTITGWYKNKKIPFYVDVITELLIVNNNLQIKNSELENKIESYKTVLKDLHKN